MKQITMLPDLQRASSENFYGSIYNITTNFECNICHKIISYMRCHSLLKENCDLCIGCFNNYMSYSLENNYENIDEIDVIKDKFKIGFGREVDLEKEDIHNLIKHIAFDYKHNFIKINNDFDLFIKHIGFDYKKNKIIPCLGIFSKMQQFNSYTLLEFIRSRFYLLN